MTPEQALENLCEQIRAYRREEQASIVCPYCQSHNDPTLEFCCKTFEKASLAAVERVNVEDARNFISRVGRHAAN